MKKKSFVMRTENLEQLLMLSDEQCGKLLKAILVYADDGTVLETDDVLLKMMFSIFKGQLDRDAAKYEEICRQRSENGKKGGRPRKANGFSDKAKKANGFSEKQTKAKKADPDSDCDSECDRDPDPDPVPECECDRESARADSTPPPTQQKMTLHGVMELAKRLGYPWDEQEAREFLVYNLDKKDRQGDWNWAAQKWEEHREERKHWKSGKAKSTSAVSQQELDDLDEYLGLSNRFMGGGNDDG